VLFDMTSIGNLIGNACIGYLWSENAIYRFEFRNFPSLDNKGR